MQLPISNDYLKVIFDDNKEPKMVPKLLPQVSTRELHNGLVSDTNYGGLKEERDDKNIIFISDSTLQPLLPPQLKKCDHDTRSCVDVIVAFMVKVYMHHCYSGVIGI